MKGLTFHINKTFLRWFACIVLTLTSLATRSQNLQLVAIGNASTTPSALNGAELKSIMRGETQRWKNGKRIMIALMKTNTQLGQATSAKVYDMSGDELNKYWLALVFQGKATAPTFFNSTDELQNFVASNPGAIGITDKATSTNEIRIITVDGKADVNL